VTDPAENQGEPFHESILIFDCCGEDIPGSQGAVIDISALKDQLPVSNAESLNTRLPVVVSFGSARAVARRAAFERAMNVAKWRNCDVQGGRQQRLLSGNSKDHRNGRHWAQSCRSESEVWASPMGHGREFGRARVNFRKGEGFSRSTSEGN
jgi:hypothetical protein